MSDAPSSPVLPVLVICPPAEQAALTAALPPAAFQTTSAATLTAAAGLPPPAVILLSLDDLAGLPQVARLVASGPPVVVLLAAQAALAAAVLAAGASDYVYRLDNWAALLPFHLHRAVQTAQACQAVQVLVAQQQRAVHQLAHDLRGPLSYLVGYSELLTMQDLPPEKVQEMAQEMLREAEKLADQIERFAPPPAS